MEVHQWDENVYQTQFYNNLRVGYIKKGDQIGYILNPFNFNYYGNKNGNVIANKIIIELTKVFKDYPLNIETLIEADKWVQQNQMKFLN